MATIDARLQNIIHWIRQTTDNESGRGVLVPISGGSDSALCFWLCTQALPRERVFGAYVGEGLPCKEWLENTGNISYLPKPEESKNPEIERWALLLSYSLRIRSWLTGTRNRTEDVLGTYSLASRVATYLPLVTLWKSEVMELAKEVGIPTEILQSSKRADPSCGRPQEMADIPFSTVDNFLKWKIAEGTADALKEVDSRVLDYLEAIYERYRFKSELPMRPPLQNSQPNATFAQSRL